MEKTTLIKNAHIYTPTGDFEPGWVLIEGKTIRIVQEGQPPRVPKGGDFSVIDADGKHLLPGFIDIHVHGAVGHEAMDASPDALRAMARFFASHGVTAFLPTTWTANRQDTLKALQAVAQVTGPATGAAEILGAHMEGPYLNRERCGAQESSLIRLADRDEALEFLDTGVVRLITLAPEFPENAWLIDECVRRGIRVSAGHTAASYDELCQALQRGVRQVTHTYNAMTGLNHRQPGTVGAALALDEITCELIADTVHVHPAVLKITVAAKTPARVILMTDSLRGTGLPDGEYSIDSQRKVIMQGGAARLPGGTLAGSTLTMDRALANIMHAAGLPLSQAWPMTSLNAACALGVSDRKGSIEAGKDADLVLLDENFGVAWCSAR